MNPNIQAIKQQSVVDQIIRVLADNQITFDGAPEVLKGVSDELEILCKQQTIQAPRQLPYI